MSAAVTILCKVPWFLCWNGETYRAEVVPVSSPIAPQVATLCQDFDKVFGLPLVEYFREALRQSALALWYLSNSEYTGASGRDVNISKGTMKPTQHNANSMILPLSQKQYE